MKRVSKEMLMKREYKEAWYKVYYKDYYYTGEPYITFEYAYGNARVKRLIEELDTIDVREWII